MPCFLCMSFATELLMPQLASPTVSLTCAHLENTCGYKDRLNIIHLYTRKGKEKSMQLGVITGASVYRGSADLHEIFVTWNVVCELQGRALSSNDQDISMFWPSALHDN